MFSLRRSLAQVLSSALALVAVGCGPDSHATPDDAIVIGALLPFTGKEAAIGRNLEQAMLLAIQDVNDAGGVDGRPLALLSRDSNSGSARGLEELLQLLYVDKVAYLVGPEENHLANEIIPDVRALDVLNVLPGYAAPDIQRTSNRGAWIRLAPSPKAIACGMAHQAMAESVETANAIVTLDDYNMNLAAEFAATFSHMSGEALPLVTVRAGAPSYVRQIRAALDYGADRTLLIAYPAAASQIATEWTIMGGAGNWFLSPMLHTEVLLVNTPFGALSGYSGISPSLSLEGECTVIDSSTTETGDGDASVGSRESLDCTRENAAAFAAHFKNMWGGDEPFAAAHFYYDAIALLAMGLQQSLATDGELPNASRLRERIKNLGGVLGQPVSWKDLPTTLSTLGDGRKLTYVGAAAKYAFNRYGIAQHEILDSWTVVGDEFRDAGTLRAICPNDRQ